MSNQPMQSYGHMGAYGDQGGQAGMPPSVTPGTTSPSAESSGPAVPPVPQAPSRSGRRSRTSQPAQSAHSSQSAQPMAPGGLSSNPSGASYPAPTASLPSDKALARRAERASRSNASPKADIERASGLLSRVADTFSQRVVGQKRLRLALTSTLLAGGHILLESVPGLAKTTAAQTLAAAVSGSFHRIQCTPDLMPNDIVGSQIWSQERGEMVTQLGPVHANMVLMDEINRSSAKTQSAMLEAMQERQTTIGGVNHKLPSPFMVMATQNPIEEEGTYVLPEAQMDRFLLKEVITYPTPVEELEVLNRIDNGQMTAKSSATPITPADVLTLQDACRRVFVHETLKAYIVDIVNTTRGAGPNPLLGWNKHVRVGASPRGGIALMQISQAIALISGRNHVMPDDIKAMRYGILRHRIIRTFDALADNVSIEGLIDAVFNAVPVP